MQTEEKERTISELLALDTYQEMTDEEIDRLIDFKVRTEVTRRITEGQKQLNASTMEQIIADNAQSCATTRSMLESLLNRKPILHSIGGENV
jgi:hypothetical protein